MFSAHFNRWDKYSSKKEANMNATLLRRCGAMDIKQGSGFDLDRNSVDQYLHSKLSRKKHKTDFKIQIHFTNLHTVL